LGAQVLVNPDAKPFSCSFHIKQELLKKGKRGKEEADKYAGLIQRSKKSKDSVEAAARQFSATSGIPARRRKMEVFPALLPPDVGTHGNTTGNVAEITHRMMDAVRGQASLFSSIRAAVDVLARRQTVLRTEYQSQVATHRGENSITDVRLDLTAPEDMVAPDLLRKYQEQTVAAQELGRPQQRARTEVGEESTFTITDGPNDFIVAPAELRTGHYEAVCTCGMNSLRDLFCRHVQRVLCDNRTIWQYVVKPWQTVPCSHTPARACARAVVTDRLVCRRTQGEAWRHQCLPLWDAPTAQAAVDGVKALHGAGQLQDNLCQPPIIIQKRGRTRSNLNAEEGRRATSFIEELKVANGMSGVALATAMVGAAATTNTGGKGVKKAAPMCGLCGVRGHKKNACPTAGVKVLNARRVLDGIGGVDPHFPQDGPLPMRGDEEAGDEEADGEEEEADEDDATGNPPGGDDLNPMEEEGAMEEEEDVEGRSVSGHANRYHPQVVVGHHIRKWWWWDITS
jgi:hypothetical protein